MSEIYTIGFEGFPMETETKKSEDEIESVRIIFEVPMEVGEELQKLSNEDGKILFEFLNNALEKWIECRFMRNPYDKK